MTKDDGARGPTWGIVLAVLVVAGACAAGGIWLGATWIDADAENTCGSVFTPGEWTGDSECSSTMWLRSAGVIALFVLAVGLVEWLLVVGSRRRRRTNG